MDAGRQRHLDVGDDVGALVIGPKNRNVG